jgi:hypothetical protein
MNVCVMKNIRLCRDDERMVVLAIVNLPPSPIAA